MSAKQFILALDQGTTSSRAILFDAQGNIRGRAQREFRQYFPQPGWVEHDAEEIWASQIAVAAEVLKTSSTDASLVAGIGIANQRETTVLWERATGRAIAPAIVWQDRRSAALCDELREAGWEPRFRERTGLMLDPYFSGTKLKWLLDHVPGARARAVRGEPPSAPSIPGLPGSSPRVAAMSPTLPTPRAPCSTICTSAPGTRTC